MGVPEDQFGVATNPPFSPIKRHSEVTEGLRQVSNIKPIILCGGVSKEVQLDWDSHSNYFELLLSY